jgi:4-hydroxy-tetrahydrodipicolinate synthase
MKLEKGFYTALGTPLDENGNLVAESLKRHIEQQIEAGASGLLLMGSMGIEAYIKNSTYAEVVKVGVEANNGRLPLFIGAMDNSIVKVIIIIYHRIKLLPSLLLSLEVKFIPLSL